MITTDKGVRMAGLGSLAVAFALAGCGGNSPLGPAAGGPSLASSGQRVEASSGVASPDKSRAKNCTSVSLTQNFNNNAIAQGSYILFTSVAQFGGNQNGVRVNVTDSRIGFTVGSTSYTVKGADSRFTLGTAHVKLGYRNNLWKMRTPAGTAGKDFLDDIVFSVPTNLPGNIRYVTWSAKFFSKSNIQPQMQWQWGAAVYTSLTNKYADLGIKPLDDQNYPPYNNDPAGTPENFKAYLTSGGTGNGNNQYTGVGGPNQNITPCK